MYALGMFLFLSAMVYVGTITDNAGRLIDVASIAIVLGLTLSVLIASGLLRDLVKGFKLMSRRTNPFSTVELKCIIEAMRLGMCAFMVSGVIGTMIGIIMTFASVDSADLLPALGVSMITLLYGFVFSMLLLPIYYRAKAVFSSME